MTACSSAINALTHLRQMRAAEQKGNFEPYRRGPKESAGSKRQAELTTTTPSKISKSPWSHKFVCLGSMKANKTPTSTEKALLSSVGLGEKVIKFRSHQTMLDEFQDVLKSEYPQLENCGGFDLLKCKPNSRNLEEIPFMVTYPILRIQQLVSTGRIYIRPLQNDLIDLDDNEIDWVSRKTFRHVTEVFKSNYLVCTVAIGNRLYC